MLVIIGSSHVANNLAAGVETLVIPLGLLAIVIFVGWWVATAAPWRRSGSSGEARPDG